MFINIDDNFLNKIVIEFSGKEFTVDDLRQYLLSNGNKNDNKNDNDIWKHIISTNHPDYDYSGNLEITADQIKKAKDTWNGRKHQFEPRLLCKHDNANKQPIIFKNNDLSLISIKNGEYLLTKGKIFIKLPKNNKKIKYINTIHKSSLLLIGNSESSLLDNLKYNNILDDVIGEKIILGPVLSGRHRCNFNTKLDNQNINISGSQYETDGCYETKSNYVIVEVKNIDVDTFNIRQLYYPSRVVYDKTNGDKNIISLFICKDKNIIKIYKYKWHDINIMNDIYCDEYFRYQFNNS